MDIKMGIIFPDRCILRRIHFCSLQELCPKNHHKPKLQKIRFIIVQA